MFFIRYFTLILQSVTEITLQTSLILKYRKYNVRLFKVKILHDLPITSNFFQSNEQRFDIVDIFAFLITIG